MYSKVFLFFSFLILSASAGASFTSQLKLLDQAHDELGLRIYMRKNFKKKLTLNEWFEARKVIINNSKVGFDLVVAWDRQVTIKSSNLEKEANKLALFLDKADELALAKQFQASFETYQRAARFIKKSNRNRVPKGNQLIYLNILHQMARTLYAQKRFDEALQVYNWIPPMYPQIRQILFEKMWAAFRADKFDVALGSIASQQSGYFSQYLPPESYLLKIYIFKRLCRKKDLQFTLKGIRSYLSDLKSGKINYLEWAKSDLYYMSLAQLLETRPSPEFRLDLVSSAEREEELKKVHQSLRLKFEATKPFIVSQIERVLGYAALASTQDQDFLKPLKSLPDSSVLESKGYEMWPSKDTEEWVDEIGTHIFIGDSECAGKK